VQSVREKSDPIDHVKKILETEGVTEADLKAIDQQIRKIVSDAADFAENSPEPEAPELYTDVLVERY
jgi:pyruvate dehydrogenase E1 component alpha subunit